MSVINMGNYQYLSQIVEPILTQSGWRLIKASMSRFLHNGEMQVCVEYQAQDKNNKTVRGSMILADHEAQSVTAASNIQVALKAQIESHELDQGS